MEISKRIDEWIDSSLDFLDCNEIITNNMITKKSENNTIDQTIKDLKKNEQRIDAAHRIIYYKLLLNNKMEYEIK